MNPLPPAYNKVILISGPVAYSGSGRAIAAIEHYEIKPPPDCSRSKMISNMLEVAERVGRRVIACFIPGCVEGAYLDRSVSAISPLGNTGVYKPLAPILRELRYRAPRIQANPIPIYDSSRLVCANR